MESEEESEEEREEEWIQRKVFHVRKANDDQWNHGKSVEVVECNGKVVNQWEVVRGVKVVEDVKHAIRAKCKQSFETSRKAIGMHGNPCKSHGICEDVEYGEYGEAAASRDKRWNTAKRHRNARESAQKL